MFLELSFNSENFLAPEATITFSLVETDVIIVLILSVKSLWAVVAFVLVLSLVLLYVKPKPVITFIQLAAVFTGIKAIRWCFSRRQLERQ